MKKAKILYNKRRKKKLTHLNINFILKFIFFAFTILILILPKNSLNNDNNNNENNKNDNNIYTYFACFVGMGREENRYVRELIEYYSKIGVEKFILGDNNRLNTEKLSDVIQDYINDGTVDIIELFGSALGQSELYQMVYEKYKSKCNWFLLFDFDEYLEVHFENGKNLNLNNFLTNEIFDKCEAILFNWVVYSDNDLIYYDNRPLNKRFTEPYFNDVDNIYVKSVVRSGLNKKSFLPNKSNHIPEKNVVICNSKGQIINNYNPYLIRPPVYDYGYLKHFTTKTTEEFCGKMLIGHPRNLSFNYEERVQIFFKHNKFSEEKLKFFEKKFNRTFNVKKSAPGFRGNNV